MQNLYQEALADAISLREMAEKNARNKIIESIAPQIKKMIERQMLAEQDEDVASDEDTDVPSLDLDALPDEGSDLPSMGSSMPSSMSGSPAPDPDEEVTHTVTTKTASGTEVKINVRVDKHGEASASAEADAAEGDDVDVELNEETLKSLSQMMFGRKKRAEKPSLAIIKQQLECLKLVSSKLPLSESKNFKEAYAIMIKNLSNFNKHVISNGSSVETRKNFNKVMKEIKNMSTSARFRRLLEQMENKKKLRKEAKLVFEPADLEGLDDEDFKSKLQGMSFGVEFAEDEDGGDEEGSVDVSDTGSAPAASPAPAAPAAPAMAEEDEMEEDDMDEMYDMDEEEDMEEMYEEMEEEEDDELEEETVFHVNESMLRKELRRIKESKKGIKDAMADQFGGGKEEGDPWLDGEVTTENVDEDDAEAIAEKALKVAKKATDAAKDEREKRKEEARANRGLKGKLDESRKMIVALREQLDEVNLFNAKLLYVNKLMQNRDLTPRQQRSIVESLDGAKSVREAQLLFNSLTESLKVKSTKMNEGKVIGSASRSTRSGSAPATLNESVEVDRWAILAGIKK